jgi:hypothetical protein
MCPVPRRLTLSVESDNALILHRDGLVGCLQGLIRVYLETALGNLDD